MGLNAQLQQPVHARLVVAAVGVVGLLVTLAVAIARLYPGLGDSRYTVGVVTVDDLQEGQLGVAAAIVLTFICAVLVSRYRRNPMRRHLLTAIAVGVLALDNLLSAVLTTGFDSLSASRFATWASAADGVIGAGLLVLASLLPDRRLDRGERRHVLLATVSILVVGSVLSAWALRDLLPDAFGTLPRRPEELELLSEHPALFLVEAITALGYATAGMAFAAIADRDDDDLSRWLSVGSAIAAVAYVNYALFPSQFTELLYVGDFLFLLAVAVLLIGAVREIGNAETRLVQQAVYLERRRVGRDLHDGVAQELAYLNNQLRAAMRDSDTARLPRVLDTAERALDETREAIAVLNSPEGDTLTACLQQASQRIARRGGADVQTDLDPTVRVQRDVQVALVRITREAVTNAVSHGRARIITVELWGETGARLRITDDGEGFDVSETEGHQGHGIASMRERSLSLRGDFAIRSAPGRGTTVEVGFP